MTTNSTVQSFDVELPREGFFEMRERKGGRLVAVAFWLEDGDRGDAGELLSDEIWHCVVDGVERDPFKNWIRASARPITHEDYRYRLARAAHDAEHRGVVAGQPIDMNTAKPAF